MTANVQLSGKTPAGVIFVVGGDTVPQFLSNLAEVVTDPDEFDAVLAEARSALVPVSAGGPVMSNAVYAAQSGLGATPMDAPSQEQRSFRATPYGGSQPAAQPPPALSGVLCRHNEQARLLPAGEYKSGAKAGQYRPPTWVCARPQAESCKLWQPA